MTVRLRPPLREQPPEVGRGLTPIWAESPGASVTSIRLRRSWGRLERCAYARPPTHAQHAPASDHGSDPANAWWWTSAETSHQDSP